jgi:hypothetical protein
MLPLLIAALLPVPAGEQTVRDAATGFQVKIRTGAFLLDSTELTQQQYSLVMGTNPSHYKGANRPVENVSWHDAITYANRRSELEGLPPCYNLATGDRRANCTGYRLPTSAEWQQAFDPAAPADFRNSGYLDAQSLLAREMQGTREVALGQPNKFGLHDMAGNVWEWCEDWYSPDPPLDALRDPQGPLNGIAKVIRGGSFLTGGTQWNRGLINSFEPTKRSRFTGFRLARTLSPAPRPEPPAAEWLAQFRTHPLPAPIPPLSNFDWGHLLGAPDLPKTVPLATPAGLPGLFDLAIDPALPTRILLTYPARKPAGRLPVILVPYYDVDTPAGADLGGRRFTPGGTRAFARIASQHGYLAVSIKWFGEADGEGYDEAVYNAAIRHPKVTPMGKWIWDVQRVIDYLETLPDVDKTRIGIIGHSLGGKMALYAAAFDKRIKAAVSSEPGISLKFSNYHDFWYLGRQIERIPKQADHHDLIGQISPRPFLLIAGESADGDKSWPFLAAFPNTGMINHRSGHAPTEQSVHLAFEWLNRHIQ